MAIELKKEDFINRISNSTKKIIGIGALAFVLTGCGSMSQNNIDNQINYDQPLVYEFNLKEHSPFTQEEIKNSNFAKMVSEAPSFNEDNYKDIILNRKSGIFKHPIDPKQVVTIIFEDNEESKNNILETLKKYNLNESILKKVNENQKHKNKSYHQEYFKENKEKDLNEVYMFDHAFDVLNEIDKAYLSKEEQNEKVTLKAYGAIMHEIAHTFPSQQMSELTDSELDRLYYSNPDKIRFQIRREISADAFCFVKQIQLLKDPEKISVFMTDLYQWKRKFLGVDTHQSYPAMKMIYDISKNDLNYLLKMNDKDIDIFSDVIARESLLVNFADAYNKPTIEKGYEVFDEILEKYKEASQETLTNVSTELNKRINSLENSNSKELIKQFELINNIVLGL